MKWIPLLKQWIKQFQRKKDFRKNILDILVFGIIIIVLFYMAFFADRTSTYKVEKDKLIIETVTEDQFNDYITVPGTVEPISIIFLDAQEGGRVEEILIEEGSMVKKGDIILRLTNPDLYLNILDSEAQLAEKENFLRNTQVTMEQERISIKRELITLKYDIERKERVYQQNVSSDKRQPDFKGGIYPVKRGSGYGPSVHGTFLLNDRNRIQFSVLYRWRH